MKKLFCLVLLVMTILLTGCTTNKLKFVEMTYEQKLSVLQEMEMIEYEGIKLSLKVSLENRGEYPAKMFMDINSYTFLKEGANYLEYLDAEFDIEESESRLTGKAQLLISGFNIYLSTDIVSTNGSTIITHKGKEKMVMPSVFNVDDYLEMLDEFNLEGFEETLTSEELEEISALFDTMKIYQGGNKTKVELTITKQIIMDLAGGDEVPSNENLFPNDSLGIMSSLMEMLGTDSLIVITINFTDNKMTNMSMEVIFIVTDRGVDITGTLSLKLDFNGSAPRVPSVSDLEAYQEVESFSVLNQLSLGW